MHELVEVKLLNCVQLFATPWTVAYRAPPSMGFSRQEYWSGLPVEWVPNKGPSTQVGGSSLNYVFSDIPIMLSPKNNGDNKLNFFVVVRKKGENLY